ncbi:peptidoglycan-binding domain-containing protein [Nonomuraea sp. NN258]|nr:peptidoglycan-binding domain-containing protein [Nonomuraea antri]
MWLVNIRRQQYVGPREAAQRKAGFEIRRETYHGEIWCPRTENQSWLARRDGTVYFTGNTYIACPHRKVFEGRGLHHLPAANGPGLNAGHYAVLGLVGNAGLVQPPDGLLHGILDAVAHLRERGRAGKEIKGHRDGYSTDCPGEPLYAWVKRGAPRPGGGDGQPTVPPFPGRLLKYPPVMRGEDVRTWQRQMSKRGWEIDVDGAYGSDSKDVCRRFQRQQGVDDDGIVGPVTWRLAWTAPQT